MASRALLTLLLAIACGLPHRALADEPAIDYLRDIKPIVAAHCYKCHGPDEQEADLRLDTGRAALEGGASGPAIISGRSAQSLLIKAVTGAGGATRMPPEEEAKALPAAQIALLRRWIDAGASVPKGERPLAATRAKPKSDHWSFQPIRRPEVPNVRRAAWVGNPIDAFILSELEQRGIAPAGEADRVTLLRRASLDLIGLAPTPHEVDAFMADDRPDAYERAIDRLLASPHYGERWARWWLDQARYADSDGYTNDGPRPMWRWRDWVINAFNYNQPFDQFVIEQLAGDLMPTSTIEQRIATAFHRNTQTYSEGDSATEEYRVENVVDRVHTTGVVLLGLTLGCARCHDHKFDPVSQREFYELFAFFNNQDEPTITVPAGSAPEHDQLQRELAAAQEELAKVDAQLEAHFKQSSEGQPQKLAWQTAAAGEASSAAGAVLKPLDDGSVLLTGSVPANDTYTIALEAPREGVTAIRLEALPHDSLSGGGPGTSSAQFVLTELRVAVTGKSGAQTAVPLIAAWADFSEPRWHVTNLLDDDAKTGWANNHASATRTAIFVLDDNAVKAGVRLVISLVQQHAGAQHLLGRFRLSLTSAHGDALRSILYPDARRLWATPPQARTAGELRQLQYVIGQRSPQRRELFNRVAALRSREQQLLQAVPTTTVLAMQERSAPRETFVHIRGDFLQHGRRVMPGVPGVLHKLPQEAESQPSRRQKNRLDLARWLTAAENPLTARVIVNRLWKQYFGRGLVETDDDFGTRGQKPTHPELLDWLASEFHDSGWDLKHVQRLIVTSATYRQSSAARPELVDIDPRNLLVARQVRLRLEAEQVRDAALAASGLLSHKLKGPSVFPPQPRGVMELTQHSTRTWTVSDGEDRYRRGFYTYFWRTSPHPFLTLFDAPEANTTCTARRRSNTPLQAITLLNDEAFVEAAQALAARTLRDAPAADDQSRLTFAFRQCLSRAPTGDELTVLRQLLSSERADDAGLEHETRFPFVTALPQGVDRQEFRAWIAVGRTLLNLDEFVTRE